MRTFWRARESAWFCSRRGHRATGASVRNFGMIWPIGQPAGEMHRMALRSREIWLEALNAVRLNLSAHWIFARGASSRRGRGASRIRRDWTTCRLCLLWLNPEETLDRSQAVQEKDLQGALWSGTEMTVDPREVVSRFCAYLREIGVECRYGSTVRRIELPIVETSLERWEVDSAIVCAGDDFETLYPEVFAGSGLTRCKLQMMRTGPQPDGWQLGPALAAGLTLRFYKAFAICSTLPRLKARIAAEKPEYERWGIHVLASQTADGAITLGRLARVWARSERFRPDHDRRFDPERSPNLPQTALLAHSGTLARSVRAASGTSIL